MMFYSFYFFALFTLLPFYLFTFLLLIDSRISNQEYRQLVHRSH